VPVPSQDQYYQRHMAFEFRCEGIVHFVADGGIANHHCLEVIVSFAEIGVIVNHHCFNFLFIILYYMV